MTEIRVGASSWERVSILGVPMDCVSMAQAVLIADDMVREHRKGAIFAINPEKIVAAGKDPKLLAAIKNAALLIPDGIGAILAARMGGVRAGSRVPGADLMPELCALAAIRGYPVFVFGARPEVAPKACVALREAYPGLQVVGFENGYLTPAQAERLPERINASGAKLLFVGLGSPRQEFWIDENLKKLSTVNICQGVGGTLDVLAGRVKRAPDAWQRSYLEWLYRIVNEPSRIKRFPNLLAFVFKVWRNGVVVRDVSQQS